MAKKPLLLCILDGWGLDPDNEYNAVAKGNTPVYDDLWNNAPHTTLRTDGLCVGLPEGQFGNSEVGHTNIGAGRIVMQDLPRITVACADGTLSANDKIQEFADQLKKNGGAAHLMGLVSDGGVHAHQSHIVALSRLLDQLGVKTYVHIFTDGRDTAPNSAKDYVSSFIKDIPPTVVPATVAGRFYAMDRDNRWERVSLAWNAMVKGEGAHAKDAVSAVEASYAADVMDEFIVPCVLGDYKGFGENDGILMANFRSDRAREILKALVLEDFDGFDRGSFTPVKNAVGLVEYSDELNQHMKVVFPAVSMSAIFGEVVAQAGLKQLRAAETEKYPHVTFFFNGGREAPYANEERLLVASPKVATYDLQPEMSAIELTNQLLPKLAEQDVIILNFANADMVGHTGSLDAAIKAVETVDQCLGRIKAELEKLGGILLVTADHGNAELMFNKETGQPHTAHTTNPVPFILYGDGSVTLRSGGVLADIAPTMLQILGVEQPPEMTGKTLIS